VSDAAVKGANQLLQLGEELHLIAHLPHPATLLVLLSKFLIMYFITRADVCSGICEEITRTKPTQMALANLSVAPFSLADFLSRNYISAPTH
jgi:hypothetical protein